MEWVSNPVRISACKPLYPNLTPPPLRQAAWSQLRPVYDQPAPGAGGADIRSGSAEAEDGADADSAPTAPPAMGGLTSSGETELGAAGRQATAPTEQCVDGGYNSTSSDSEPEGGWAAKWAEEALGPAGSDGLAGRDSTRHADAASSQLASESRRYRDARDGGSSGRGGGWAKPCWFAAGAAAHAGGDCGGSGCGCWCWEGAGDDGLGRGATGSGQAQARVERSADPGSADAVTVASADASTAIHATTMDAGAAIAQAAAVVASAAAAAFTTAVSLGGGADTDGGCYNDLQSHSQGRSGGGNESSSGAGSGDFEPSQLGDH